MLKFYDLCSMNLFLFIQFFIFTNFNIKSSFQEKVDLSKVRKYLKTVSQTLETPTDSGSDLEWVRCWLIAVKQELLNSLKQWVITF